MHSQNYLQLQGHLWVGALGGRGMEEEGKLKRQILGNGGKRMTDFLWKESKDHMKWGGKK